MRLRHRIHSDLHFYHTISEYVTTYSKLLKGPTLIHIFQCPSKCYRSFCRSFCFCHRYACFDFIYGLLHHKYGCHDVMLTRSVTDMCVLMSNALCYITDMAVVAFLWQMCFLSSRHVHFLPSQIRPSWRHFDLFCHRYACLGIMSGLFHHRYGHHDVVLTCYVTDMPALTSHRLLCTVMPVKASFPLGSIAHIQVQVLTRV